MDNDVYGTDYCIGFSTALTRSVDLITNFRTALGSHERIGVVELFGRNSGETSFYAAYLADADRAIIPEVPFDVDKLSRLLLEDRARNPSRYAIVTISEGAVPEGGDVTESGEADAFGHRKLGGIGDATTKEIKRLTGVDMMFQQLGYVIRSGPPDVVDKMVGRAFGILACDEIARGRSGQMVALQGGSYTTVPLDVIERTAAPPRRRRALRQRELQAQGARGDGQAHVPLLRRSRRDGSGEAERRDTTRPRSTTAPGVGRGHGRS